MSELKVHNARYEQVLDEVYLKSEADKVIAELKDKCQMQQPTELLKPRIMENGCEYYLAGEVRMCIEQAARQIVESNSVYKELDTIIKHQKHKRCLAMWLYLRECYWRCMHHNEQTRADWYNKWMDKFQKLAEHYKAAK